MNNIVLGEEQQYALDYIKRWIRSRDTECLLEGPAGSGKSRILSSVLDYLHSIRMKYVLTAPTHKATLVMKQYTGKDAATLHSLLALSPKIDILELDFKDLEFECGDAKTIPTNGIIICDEASMINDALYKFIQEQCEKRRCKVLYLSDFRQIQPVNKRGYSEVIHVKNQVHLTKIYRQDNESALTPVLAELRKHYLTHFDLDIREKGSTFVYTDAKEFLSRIIDEFRKSIQHSDILNTKVLAYTNKRVKMFNQAIHKLLFESESEYNKLGFLTGYDNVTWNNKTYHNGMDYIIINDPKKIDIVIPGFGVFPAYSLELYDSLDEDSDIIHILSKDIDKEYFDKLAEIIEDRRLSAVRCENRQRRALYWKSYFEMMDSFCSPIDLYFDNRLIRRKTFDYGYASSVHKAQGSTFSSVAVDMKDIFKQKDPEELRQLQYVALSRTRKDAFIYV